MKNRKLLKSLSYSLLGVSFLLLASCGDESTTTQKPTTLPPVSTTVVPTVVPTSKPTTVIPTVVPTIAPTVVPTVAPTVAPTVVPTVAPTVAPTVVPTVRPTPPPPLASDAKYYRGNGQGATVNVGVNYVSGGYHYGVTYQGDEASKDLDGKDLLMGTKLPYWKEIEKQLNVTVNDAADYNFASLGNEWQNYNANGKFELKDGRQIDLIMADGTHSVTSANKGLLMPIDNLVEQGKLPNLKLWIESNPTTWNSMKSADGHVYFTPYYDGIDHLEKMFLMDQKMVKKLLDEKVTFDTAKVVETYYTPQVPEMNNEKIDVAVDGDVRRVTVNYSANENIIKIQNELSVKNGQTFTQALRDYIDLVYGDYIGKGKLYANRSDIFFSAQACYNADELVALLRCANANPQLLTGTDEIYPFAPRTGEANRQRQVAELMSIFGVRGRSSEKDLLYFDKDGVLQDGRTKVETYEALDLLNAMYKEGLFPADYYKGFGHAGFKSDWRKNLMKTGQVFMLYEYNDTTTANNSDSNVYNVSQMQAILPPVVKWDAGENIGQQNYFHFSEDSRQLKSGGWAIPATANNIDAVCAIVDYSWMPEGSDLQNFGPNTTTYRNAVTLYDDHGERISDEASTMKLFGQEGVKLSQTVLNQAGFVGGWNNWCRKFIGTTQGIGHIRSAALNYQVCTSAIGRAGLDKLSYAMEAGTLTVAKSNGENFFKTVPTLFAISPSDDAAINASSEAQKMHSFWLEKNPREGYLATGYSKWICEGKTGINTEALIGNYQTWVESFAAVDNVYITAYRKALF